LNQNINFLGGKFLKTSNTTVPSISNILVATHISTLLWTVTNDALVFGPILDKVEEIKSSMNEVSVKTIAIFA